MLSVQAVPDRSSITQHDLEAKIMSRCETTNSKLAPIFLRSGETASPHHQQRGVVLFIALIVLVAMTLAAIALVRAVDTSTQVAGNIGFKQSTVQSSDMGGEQAISWLLLQKG